MTLQFFYQLKFQRQRNREDKPKSVHLHDALSTSDAIVLTKGGLGKGKGEDNCRQHLHLDWTNRGVRCYSYMEQVTTYVLKDPTCVSGED